MRAEFALPFSLPDPAGGEPPAWTGRGFRRGDGSVSAVLDYPVGDSGWSDDLTSLHEESAGGHHYIDVASRRHALAQLGRHARGPGPWIMEIGCSSGYFLDALAQARPDARLLGADFALGPLRALAARNPGLPLLRFDLTRCPLPDGALDAVVALNVLEHIERDDLALAHILRILKPGGIAVLEVPAGPALYDGYDEALMHHRRYTLRELVRKAETAGLVSLFAGHLGFFLYPAFAFVKKRNQRRRASGRADSIRAVKSNIAVSAGDNPLLHRLMRVEDALRRFVPLPCGIRCLLTVQRPAH